MKKLLKTAALAIAIGTLSSTQTGAQTYSPILVGFNQDMQNNTGQPVYDFHIFGTLESIDPPVQVAHWEYSTNEIDYGWVYNGGTIIHTNDPNDPWNTNIWAYSGSWSGTNPIPPGGVIHLGKYWYENGFNVWMHLYGYWTDEFGNKINPNAGNPGQSSNTWVSDVPLIGFRVDDNANTLTVENATTNFITVQNFQLAMTSTQPAISNLVAGSPFLAAQSWTSVPLTSLASGTTETFSLTNLGIMQAWLTTNEFILMEGEQSSDGSNYTFFVDIHGITPTPIPTLSQWGLIIFGVILLATGAFFILRKRTARAPA